MVYTYIYILCPFLLTIKSVRFSIDCIVLSTISTGTLSSVVLTQAENSSKSSHSIFFLKASWCNFFFIIWKIFSIEFRSGLHAGIVYFRALILSQADLTLWLFSDQSPSCKNNFRSELAHFLDMLAKCSWTKEENVSALILPNYCSTAITPFSYAIAAIKCATLSPVPSWLPFEVKPKSNPCSAFLHTIALHKIARLTGTRSLILFTMFLQIVALEYFP